MSVATRICKRIYSDTPRSSSLLCRTLTGRSAHEKLTNTHKLGHFQLIGLFERAPSSLALNYQQSAGKKKKEKGRGFDVNTRMKLPQNIPLKDIVDLNVVSSRLQNELVELQQSYFSINVKTSPSVLSSVYIRIGVENVSITDICNIVNEPGKSLVLDCSLYPEELDKVLEAVNKETVFDACLHSKNCLKLSAPKISNELRTRLIRQAKEKKNQRMENGRKLIRESIRTVEGAKADMKQVKRIRTYLDELLNHFKKQTELMYKEKEAGLKEDLVL